MRYILKARTKCLKCTQQFPDDAKKANLKLMGIGEKSEDSAKEIFLNPDYWNNSWKHSK